MRITAGRLFLLYFGIILPVLWLAILFDETPPRGNARPFNNLGVAYQKVGRLAEAEGAYLDAIRIAPGYNDAIRNLATVYSLKGDYEKAEPLFSLSLLAFPQEPLTHFNYGNMLISAGRLEEAIYQHRVTLYYEPRHADSYVNIGSAEWNLGRHREALKSYWRALVLFPGFPPALNNVYSLLREKEYLYKPERSI